MPAQEGPRADNQAELAEMTTGQQPGQRGQDRPVGPGQLRFLTWRWSAATWCRRIRISASMTRLDRANRASQPNTRNTARQANRIARALTVPDCEAVAQPDASPSASHPAQDTRSAVARGLSAPTGARTCVGGVETALGVISERGTGRAVADPWMTGTTRAWAGEENTRQLNTRSCQCRRSTRASGGAGHRGCGPAGPSSARPRCRRRGRTPASPEACAPQRHRNSLGP